MSTSKKKRNEAPNPIRPTHSDQQLQIKLTRNGPDLTVEIFNAETQEFEQIADDRAEIALAKLNSEIYSFRFLRGSSND